LGFKVIPLGMTVALGGMREGSEFILSVLSLKYVLEKVTFSVSA